MPRVELSEFLDVVISAAPEVGQLRAGDYIAAGIKVLKQSDLPHIADRSSRQTHVALTDIKGTMRLFPLVTSPLYENSLRKDEDVDRGEKTFYVNEIRFRCFRANILKKLEESTGRPEGYFTYETSDRERMAEEVRGWPATTDGYVTAVAQIRGSAQLQLELSRADDSLQWKVLYKTLDVGDHLVILQKPNMTYDFVLLGAKVIQESLTESELNTLETGVQAAADACMRVTTTTPRRVIRQHSAGPGEKTVLDQVVEACRTFGSSHFIVLWGVPATGKSHVAEAAAGIVAQHDSRVRIVQFHPTYTYADLFEGYRPTREGGFVRRRGVLSEINAAALRDPTQTYVLLIDEFSRADVPAVIGELLTHIEYRGRGFKTPFGRTFTLAPNLVFLGTMNPQDRSALELDDAILRRFRTIKILPSADEAADVLRKSLENGGETTEERELIAAVHKLFADTQAAFPEDYSEQMPFGPWLFKGVRHWESLDLLWEQQIEQLIKRPGGTRHPFYDTIVALRPRKSASSAGTLDGDTEIPAS